MTLVRFLPNVMRPGRSLMARLVGSFLTVSLLTVFFVAAVAFFGARNALREAVFERLMTVAIEKEGELNRWVSLQRDSLVFLASIGELAEDAALLDETGNASARARLESLLASAARSDLEEVFVLSPVGGEVIVSTERGRRGDYRVNDLFYSKGKASTFVQNVYTSPITGRPALTIATPVRDATGSTVAVLAAHLNLALVDAIVADRTGLGASGEAYLVSPFNDFVSSERFGRLEYRRGIFSEGINAALDGETGMGLYPNYAGTPVIGAYRWNESRELGLLVEMDQAEAFGPARELVGMILGIGVASALLLAGGVFFIARQIARPVLAITKAATAVADGDFTTVAPVLTGDEVGVLASAFNEMTARLRRLYVDLNEQVEATTGAMRALEESKQLLQAIIDNSTTLIAVSDPENRFLLLNRSFETVLGVPQEKAIGKTAADFLPGDVARPYTEMARSAFETKRVAERELVFDVGGVPRTFILVCFPLLTDEDEPYGVGVVATDLTELKEAEEAHRHLEAQVQHAQKLESLGLMAGGIAHDFNNILTGLSGNTELALRKLDTDSSARVYLQRVLTASRRAADLVGQMLAYAGKASFHREIVDLNAVVEEVSQLVKTFIPKKVDYRIELAPSPVAVKANRAQLSQLVMNLITNAAEAVGEQAGTVVVTTVSRGASARLTVSDSGVGMDEKTKARIFDPFFSTKGPGRGLGLAAVVGIVKATGGRLSVESARGSGSTFEVNFPAASDRLQPSAQASTPAAPPEGSGTVLVVDDEPMVRHMARELLESSGYDVIEVSTGLEAVDTYRRLSREIDAVLLDMTMPGMSGAEALEAIRDIDPSAGIILSSGYDEEDTVARLGEAEHVEFLQKPYRARILLAKLNAVLERRLTERAF